MTQEEFIQLTVPFFIRYGYRGFKVDQISKELRISKETIYDLFPNKKEMIKAVLDYEISHFIHLAEQAKKERDFFHNIQALRELVYSFEETSNINKNFLELKKYYRQLYDYHYDKMQKMVYQFVMDLLHRGSTEGFVKESFNFDLVAGIFSSNYQEMIVREYPDVSLLEGYINNYINMLIQGILTPKGFEILHQMETENKNSDG